MPERRHSGGERPPNAVPNRYLRIRFPPEVSNLARLAAAIGLTGRDFHHASPVGIFWNGRRDSNSPLKAWKACALPLCYARKLVPSARIERASEVLQTPAMTTSANSALVAGERVELSYITGYEPELDTGPPPHTKLYWSQAPVSNRKRRAYETHVMAASPGSGGRTRNRTETNQL